MLGFIVLFGWYSHNETLVQVSPAFVPMQYNTALGFLVSGLGLLMTFRPTPSMTRLLGGLAAVIGGLTLVEYVFGVDLAIDQLLMDHYITVETSHPGRMAPNTALCFSLTGAALVFASASDFDLRIGAIVGIAGTLVFGLGLIAFSGYAIGLETAYGWGHLTRMAVHTSAGFIVLGAGLTTLAWHRDHQGLRARSWFPFSIGIGILTLTVSLWQALVSVDAAGIAQHFVLVFGATLSGALAWAIRLLKVARIAERELSDAHDQLEVKVAERTAEVAEREARFRRIFETDAAGMAILDMDGRYIQANAKFCEIVGYGEDELTELNWRDITHPEDIEATAELDRQVEQGLRNDFFMERRLIRKDGDIVWTNLSSAQLRDEGGVSQSIFSFIQDITDLKEAERLIHENEKNLQNLLDSAPIGIGVVDQSTNDRLFVNQRLVEMLGGTSADELTAASLAASYVDPKDVDRLRQTVAAGGVVENIEVQRRRMDGSTFWSLQSSQALGMFRGRDARVVWMVDVSALKDAERELENTNAQISSSIEYASNIQRSVLPNDDALIEALGEYFVAWEPKDIVGGDFYWIREWGEGRLLVIGDCTGHGVPGAFMTLIATATFNRSLRQTSPGRVGELMACINGRIQEVLGQNSEESRSDDGMDVGMVYMPDAGGVIEYCGAGISLFAQAGDDIDEYKGHRHGVGYGSIPTDQVYDVARIDRSRYSQFYLASDGVFDQTGGARGHGFGKARFKDTVLAAQALSFEDQKKHLLDTLDAYQGDEPRRDDITIIGFGSNSPLE